MGRQTARVAAALGDDAFLAGVVRAIDDGLAPGHHAAVFGSAAGRFGAGAETVAAAYLYSTAVLLVGAGLRLLTLGQLDGQRVLAAVRPPIARLAAAAARATAEDMWTFTPALELAGLRHARLDMRLFRS
jgi:urease accessory protein